MSNKTEANKTVFGNGGGQDEIEQAKNISLGVLRNRTAMMRASGGGTEDFRVERVSIDELKMAHTVRAVRRIIWKI